MKIEIEVNSAELLAIIKESVPGHELLSNPIVEPNIQSLRDGYGWNKNIEYLSTDQLIELLHIIKGDGFKLIEKDKPYKPKPSKYYLDMIDYMKKHA